MGGWTLRNGRLIKSSYMVLNELKACQPTESKVQQKKKKKKKKKNTEYLLYDFNAVFGAYFYCYCFSVSLFSVCLSFFFCFFLMRKSLKIYIEKWLHVYFLLYHFYHFYHSQFTGKTVKIIYREISKLLVKAQP